MADGREVGFLTMGRAGGRDEGRPIGIGMLGYAFMGKATRTPTGKSPT